MSGRKKNNNTFLDLIDPATAWLTQPEFLNLSPRKTSVPDPDQYHFAGSGSETDTDPACYREFYFTSRNSSDLRIVKTRRQIKPVMYL
jgi:hypothetical protein